jgi:hypothetical protein
MSSRKELIGALGALLRRLRVSNSLDDLRNGVVLENAAKVYRSALRGNIAPLPWTPLARVAHGTVTPQQVADIARSTGVSVGAAQAMFDRIRSEETLWANETYQVSVRDLPGFATLSGKVGQGGRHLSIKRIDQEPVHDWRDLQRIKNELLGPECEAVELYPAESRLVDSANQYHLWGTADPAFRFGFGFEDRFTSDDSGSHHQRPDADARG